MPPGIPAQGHGWVFTHAPRPEVLLAGTSAAYDTGGMKTMSIPYPETLPEALHLSSSEFEREARTAMAVKLFDAGRLSSGQAAALAGLPRVHFLYELGRWGVSPVQMETAELDNDLAVASRLHERH